MRPFLLLSAILFVFLSPTAQTFPDDRVALRRELAPLQEDLAALRNQTNLSSSTALALPDTELFARSVEWALRYEPNLSAGDLALVKRGIQRGSERLKALQTGQTPWAAKAGRLVRGYRSEVDGSVQPYGLIIPASYDPKRPIRLDVVLHGSSQPVGMSEMRFLSSFDEGDNGGKAGEQDYIELHPLGRVENCYRWAGETDVFEAIEDVCRKYNIDRDRIVLRGMSMGASGTWHLGLKHPDTFVALGPYCGYVDTHRFSETPGMNFVKVGPLPAHQEAGLHMLDSVDYAANAGVVPVVAAIGEKDPFFQAHVTMGQAFRDEGLTMLNLISPSTGHVQDPVTWTEQMRRIGEHAAKGLDHQPKHIRFVTWTLKYSRCHWLEALTLGRHYERAELEGDLERDGIVRLKEPRNITRFALYAPAREIRIGSRTVRLPAHAEAKRGLVLEKRDGVEWRFEGYRDRWRTAGKRPGVQGPIDDAFTRPFLLVRGTGEPWNKTVDAWAKERLRVFTYEYARYFRGDPRVKDDIEVTTEDRKRYNLILFGDPGSNRVIRDALPKLPLRWSRETLEMDGERYASAENAPALIAPSPFAPDRYVVVNSGHTFHEAELNRLNYLLFPRHGDWAVFNAAGNTSSQEPVKAGYFDEGWRFPKDR